MRPTDRMAPAAHRRRVRRDRPPAASPATTQIAPALDGPERSDIVRQAPYGAVPIDARAYDERSTRAASTQTPRCFGDEMFLDLLNRDQHELLIDAVHHLMRADGQVDPREPLILARIQRDAGTDYAPREIDAVTLAERAATLLTEDPLTARAFFAELAGVAVIDGSLEAAERSVLSEVAAAVGIPNGHISSFVEFAERAEQLAKDGERLIATSNTAGG